MFKKLRKNEKGFTLAELLIVVAIIGVLVAISIPIFTSQLEKSREATDLANLRAAKAEAVVAVLDGKTLDATKTYYYNASTGVFDDAESAATKIGKGTAAAVPGVQYTTDPVYTQFKYSGGDVAGKSITAKYTIPTDGTEPSVEVKFN